MERERERGSLARWLRVLIASVNKLYQPGSGRTLLLVNKNARPAGSGGRESRKKDVKRTLPWYVYLVYTRPRLRARARAGDKRVSSLQKNPGRAHPSPLENSTALRGCRLLIMRASIRAVYSPKMRTSHGSRLPHACTVSL